MSSCSPVLLECRDVSVLVRSKSLLESVSFCLKKGEHKVLLGPNGAGKTSLIRAILGGLALADGEVLLGGVNVANLERREIARQVAYVPQLLAADVPYSVREFVGMGRYAHGGSAADEAVTEAMDLVGVREFSERVVGSLSGGERQRVCIAAALAQQSPLLILDEPLAHLDPAQRMEVQGVLRALPESVTMLVVTHDLAWARRGFASVLALKSGRTEFEGSVGAFFQNEGVTRLFGDAVGAQCRGEGW